jgi:hypothetical protein
VRGDRTQKLYQRVQVVDQGKSCSDGDKREQHGFTPEFVSRFVF